MVGRWKGLNSFLIIVGLFSSVTDAQSGPCQSTSPKIVGGSSARLADWPGQAALRLQSETALISYYFCGGTAIADRWILTAAHCLPNFIAKLSDSIRDSSGKWHEARLEVVLGSDDLRLVRSEHAYSVERIVIHENYRAAIDEAMKIVDPVARKETLRQVPMMVGYDIALVRLSRPWAGPIAILSLTETTDPLDTINSQVRVAGFGITEHNLSKQEIERFDLANGEGELFAGSAMLLESTVETIARLQCSSRYSGYVISEGQVCAGLEQGGKDSCQGDSGGPLVAYDESGCPRQIGIVSWGDGCAQEKAYGVYTRVSHYAEWIQRYAGPLTGARPVTVAGGGNHLTATQIDQALSQLETLLSSAKGRVRTGVRGGNRVKLGSNIVFEAKSDIPGRLIVLDISADGQVIPLFPNKYVSARDLLPIAAGRTVVVPGPDYPEFASFAATEPVGMGRLLALVVPDDFDVERFVATSAVLTKGFQPVSNPQSFLMRLVRQIETMFAASSPIAGDAPGELTHWAYEIVEYEIAQ